jgi:ParB-like chromosome segregation protein Spo0J
VVDGHRRLAALHGVHGADSETLIPCRVVELTDENVRLMAQLTANMQRADFNPWDLAAAIAQLVEQGEDTAIIAMATGRKRRWVQEQASIGKWLVEPARQWLKDGKLSISQAVALAAVRDPKEQSQLAHRAITEAMSEDAIREATAARKARKAAGDDDDEGEAVEAPKPKRKHQKARKVQAAPPSLDELRKPPAWAAGIVKARFVVVDATGATARLVKGWAAMVEAAHPADEEATALVLQADTWVADSEGVAFAHACGAYRLTDE